MKTVPGPVNLHTKPSPEARPEIKPPEATRSRMYLVFQATRCPLSTMYFSPSTSYNNDDRQFSRINATKTQNGKLTSFRMIAPKLVNHNSPVPEILYTHRPSPLNMALPRPWRL